MNIKPYLLALPLVAVAPLTATDAEACGGCFVQQSENTQVSGHRMILSVSPEQTTLWDQITYDGNPEEFAWVLPIKGTVEIGLSSDALFAQLEGVTQVSINSPFINCPPPPDCGFSNDSAGAGGAGGQGEPPVTVLAQETVGPFDTVQLESSDPQALNAWLVEHGYNIPADVEPVITDYVNEGFNFLALRLVPGEGIDAMRPVRITSAGASATLPLRMVAAGTGATTPISLWVVGEGRYEPQNFPTFTIGQEEITWDWDEQKSDYAEIRQQRFDESGGAAWLMEVSQRTYGDSISWQLEDLAQYDPIGSGYADENGLGAEEALAEDLNALFGNIDQNAMWVTRMYAELSRPALATDLALGASMDQSEIYGYLEATNAVGTPPACPSQPGCSGDDWEDGPPWMGPNSPFGNNGDRDPLGGQGGCSVGGDGGFPTEWLLIGLGAGAFVLSSRRRRRR